MIFIRAEERLRLKRGRVFCFLFCSAKCTRCCFDRRSAREYDQVCNGKTENRRPDPETTETMMARAPRFDFPETIHHVTNRGLERRDIVRSDADRKDFTRLLGRVFAWVLMNNHFHVFFYLPRATLSQGMHDFESGYATLFNRRHGRSGPLFQGRFHDVVVENESHCLEVSRYVHLNPCRAGLADRPEAWRWSSYHDYLDPRTAPQWLDWPTVLAELSHNEAAARIAYKRFVDSGLDGSPNRPFDQTTDGWILGSPAFTERIQGSLFGQNESAFASIDEILETVARGFGNSVVSLRRRGTHGNEAREVAMLLCRELVNVPASELATSSSLSSSGFATALGRCRERMDSDPAFAIRVARIRAELES